MAASSPPSPFRDVWVVLGRLRERPEVEDSPEARELGRQLALRIGEAEREWVQATRGPREN